jgi:hypothetical protein
MRADKTERLYQCAVTVAMIEAIVVPLFGFIVGPYYHKPSLATAPAFTEQQRVAIDDPRGSHITTGALPTLPCEKPALATAIVQESQIEFSTLVESARERSAGYSMNSAILSVSAALIGSTVGGLAPS